MGLLCKLLGHNFGTEIVRGEKCAQYVVCRRCAEKKPAGVAHRYTLQVTPCKEVEKCEVCGHVKTVRKENHDLEFVRSEPTNWGRTGNKATLNIHVCRRCREEVRKTDYDAFGDW